MEFYIRMFGGIISAILAFCVFLVLFLQGEFVGFLFLFLALAHVLISIFMSIDYFSEKESSKSSESGVSNRDFFT